MNVLKWINNYFDNPKQLKEQDLEPILYFSLLWNFFEHNYFTKNNRLKHELLYELSKISIDYINEEDIDMIFDHFQNRYLKDNNVNSKFYKLQLYKSKQQYLSAKSVKKFCEDVIICKNPIIQDKLIVTFFIIHRFRNNLFHGNKNTATLNVYSNEFKVINKFLMTYFDQTSKIKSINKERFKQP